MAIPKTVHFFWWGNPGEKYRDHAITFVNKLAELKPDQWRINYWYDSRQEQYFAPKLHKNIARNPITDFELPGEKEVGKTLYANTRKVLKSLEKYNAYSAVKDLFEFYILYVQGGFHFDTTTLVPVPNRFFSCLNSENTSPQFVANNVETTLPYFAKLDARLEQLIGSHNFHPSTWKNVARVPALEYWSVSADMGDGLMLACLKRYVARWLFIEGRMNPRKWQTGIDPTKPKDPDRLTDLAIGRLVDWSAKDAFIGRFGNNFDAMLAHCYQKSGLNSYYKLYGAPSKRKLETVLGGGSDDKSGARQTPTDEAIEQEYDLLLGKSPKTQGRASPHIVQLFKETNINNWQDFRAFLEVIHEAIEAAGGVEFRPGSWSPRYEVLKQSGGVWRTETP